MQPAALQPCSPVHTNTAGRLVAKSCTWSHLHVRHHALGSQLSHSSHSQILGTSLCPPCHGFSAPTPIFRWKKLHGCNKARLSQHNGGQAQLITVTRKAVGKAVNTGRGVAGLARVEWWWGGLPVGRLTDSLHFLLCCICCQVVAEEEDETRRTNCLRRLH